jgi:hypothetical protein
MFFNYYEEIDFFPDLSFLFFTFCALFMIKKESIGKDSIHNKREEKEKHKNTTKNNIKLKNTIKFDSNSFYKTYSFLLKDILEAPNIKRVDSNSTIESYDSEMPTFQDMLNPKRRSYSADDIDSLDLICDIRIKDAFKKALTEKICKSPVSTYSQMSEQTLSSWDNLSINE